MPQKMNTASYIEKAKLVHGDTFDYSLVEYSNATGMIKLVCKVHGVFSVKASSHLQGVGCSKCSGKFRYNAETFAEAGRAVHGDEFDYSQVKYKNNKTPVSLTCSKGHTTMIAPANHLNGTRCSKCTGTAKLTTEEFIARSVEIHGSKYDYSKAVYKTSQQMIKIICPVHGEFEQLAYCHMTGQGCPKCRGLGKTTDEFVKEAKSVHGDKYNYEKSVYVTSKTKLTIACPKHGDFQQSPNSHLKGSGCPECCGIRKHTTESFVASAVNKHGDKYNYEKVKYGKNNTEPVVIICPTHGEFLQRPMDHLESSGCPKCGLSYGQSENEVREFVNSLGFETTKDRTILEGKEIDIYVPEKKVGIEYNGLYWHSDAVLENAINVHKYKTDLAATKGIRLLHLFEDDWKNKRGLVERYIKQALGVIDKRIYARKCDVVELTSKDANAFLTTNHIQGKSASQIHYGLMYNSDLVAVMQFSNNTSNRGIVAKGVYELTRYATSCSVVGGASKLFTRFVNAHKPTEVFSFSDRSWFSGGMYEKLGFVKVSESGPDYKVIDNDMRKHKSLFKRVNLAARFGDRFDPSLSERDNCHKLGLYRIYDCGKIKWSYTNSTKEQ